MNQQIFPYPGADGNKSSFVRSTTSAEIAQVRDFFCYERPTLRFKPVEQNPGGAFNARVQAFAATGYTAVALLYTKAAGQDIVALGTTPVMNWDEDGYFDGTLNLNTDEAIAATEDLAAGGYVNARFAFILFGGGGEPFIVEQGVRLFHSLPPAGLPAPTPVTELILVNLLEAVLANSDTVTWERVEDTMVAHVPLFGAPSLLAPLSITYTKPSAFDPAVIPTDDEVSATVGGVAGERYLIRARFAGNVEMKAYTGGYQKPGDTHVYRGGNNGGDNSTDEWYLDISSPAQRIYLNHGTPAAVAPVDHPVRFVADAGATVTLGFDSMNGGSSSAGNGALTFVSAAEVLGPHLLHRSSVAASAHTGNTTETTKATVAIPPLAAHSQLRLAATFSRPTGQAGDAFLLARLGGTLLWRQRVGPLRGGAVDVVVLANRCATNAQLLAFDTEADWLVGTAAINTAVATTLAISVQLADSADSITLEALTVTRETP